MLWGIMHSRDKKILPYACGLGKTEEKHHRWTIVIPKERPVSIQRIGINIYNRIRMKD